MGITKIEWAEKVWNPITGCTPISEGCQNCYAARMAKRLAKNPTLHHHDRYEGFKVSLWPERLSLPLRWRKPCRIFVNSMGDLFHEDVPLSFIAEVFSIMASATAECGKNHKHEEECWTGDSHTFMILTKRPERMRQVVNELPSWVCENFSGDSTLSVAMEVGQWPLPNVWLGVTVENQEAFNKRVPALLDTPAVKWFLSAEPLLGPINYRPFLRFDRERKWVIAGGETGPKARPVLQSWVVSARNQCHNHEVPFFFKGWGTGTIPKKSSLYNKIDGRTYEEFPK